MIVKWVGALFAPKYPRHYTGRHRAPRNLQPADRYEPDLLSD